jgi:catechol 2,3-dioxygenase-like lactoylglutathione lyase family enzyme
MASICRVRSLDHLAPTVKDLQVAVDSYVSAMGMKYAQFVSMWSQRHALIFGRQKINLHLSGKEFEPKAQMALPGLSGLSFLIEDVGEVCKRLRERNIELLEGRRVFDQTGAREKLRSAYIRDPDGDLIE